jgi:hypothetical protein
MLIHTARHPQLARLNEHMDAMRAQLDAHRAVEAQDRQQALEVCWPAKLLYAGAETWRQLRDAASPRPLHPTF